jgi:hypothetical protein
MKYYITTPELAEGISSIKAKQLGCTGTTQFWWAVTHCDNNISYISFSDEECLPEITPATYNEEGEELTPEIIINNRILYQNPPEDPVLVIRVDDLVDHNYMVENGLIVEVTE